MERRFKEFVVLKNIYARISIYAGKPLAVEQEIIRAEILGDIYKWKDYRFHMSWFQEWERLGYIEEILPNKKPISSEENTNIEEDIYSKKYNIYEILTLIPNLPTNTIYKCSLDSNEWMPTFSDKSLKLTKGSERCIEEVYYLKEILEATYTIIKPIEEVKEKWIEISCSKELCSAISNGKTIRVGNGAPMEKYNNKQITTLFGALNEGIVKLEYLEEK